MAAPVALLGGPLSASAQVRLSFQIATGSTSGTYFPVGQMLAAMISHPPGVGRCEKEGVCGPPGLLAAAKTSEGSVANARAVNEGRVASAFIQSDVAGAAFKGEGLFKPDGPLTELRAIASLYPELVHLVIAAGTKIESLSDLRRKRVAIDTPGSGTNFTAREILASVKLGEKSVQLVFDGPQKAASRLVAGELDAFFFIGGPPLPVLETLLASGEVALAPLTGDAIAKLVERIPALRRARIPADLYAGVPTTETLAVGALWAVGAGVPDDVVYAITRALWSGANRRFLDSGHPIGRLIRPEIATFNLPIPLHPGAARYYEAPPDSTAQR